MVVKLTCSLCFSAIELDPLCYLFTTWPGAGPLEQQILDFISSIYTVIHWPGVVALMALESACIPVPSELIMPLAGWMLIKV